MPRPSSRLTLNTSPHQSRAFSIYCTPFRRGHPSHRHLRPFHASFNLCTSLPARANRGKAYRKGYRLCQRLPPHLYSAQTPRIPGGSPSLGCPQDAWCLCCRLWASRQLIYFFVVTHSLSVSSGFPPLALMSFAYDASGITFDSLPSTTGSFSKITSLATFLKNHFKQHCKSGACKPR